MQYIVAGFLFFATFLAELFTRLISSGLEYASKRLFIIASMLVVLASFVSAFYFLMRTTISGLSSLLPPFFSQAASLVVPDNTYALMSVYITARLARFVYEWNIKVLQWRL